jgi:hypothetical protein
MFSVRINRRIFSREEITDDDSVKEICYVQVANWKKVLSWYKGIGMLPVRQEWKGLLRSHIYTGAYFSTYLIESPTIAIYKWPNKEQRWFLVTRNGNLIEPDVYSIWDKYFSCIFTDSVGFSIRVPQERVHEREIEKSIWFPSQVNFTHFLIDSFAPLAQLDQLLSARIGETYFVPLVGNQPSWQAEYMDKLSLQKVKLEDGGDKCSLIILKPKSLALPMFSCKPAAYLPLREFLYTRSVGKGDAVVPKNIESRCILLSRRDQRRRRVRNIDQIEELVVSLGGMVVDPSVLGIEDRFEMIGNSRLCIAEGSGTTNALVYGIDSTQAINLTDPEALENPELLHGGWPYLVYRSHLTRFMVGSSRVDLEGSPLGSAYYPVDKLARTIIDSENLRNV